MRKLLSIVLFCICIVLTGQKPSLDHSVYDNWKSIGSTIISADGKWVAYTVLPQQGDGWLFICNLTTGRKDSVARGTNPVFSHDSKFLTCQVLPSYAETRQAKKKKLKDEQMPKNSIEIRDLGSGSTLKIERVKSFSIPDENSYWMAYLLEKKADEKKEKNNPADSLSLLQDKVKKTGKTPEPKGTELILYNPELKKEYRYSDVAEFSVAKEGRTISFVQDFPDTAKTETFKVNIFNTRKESVKQVFEGKGSLKKLTTDKAGDNISFIFSSDTSKIKIYSLFLSVKGEDAVKVTDSSGIALQQSWSVSENGTLTFSDEGSRLFFGTAPAPRKEPEDTLLDDEKYRLDIWSWDDDLLQPMQKKQLEQELKRSYYAVCHTGTRKIVSLSDSSMPSLRITPRSKHTYLLGSSDIAYRKSSSWDSRNYTDYYIVDIESGKRTMILEKHPAQVILSPSGRWILYWDMDSKRWMSLSADGKMKIPLTSNDNVVFYDELNDLPDDPSPYGFCGWLDDEKHVLIYDRYDIWSYNIEGNEKPVNLTNGFGRKNNLRLRYVKLDPESDYILRKDPMCLSAFNLVSKEAGFFSLKPYSAENPVLMLFEKASFNRGVTKAKNAGVLTWQKESFAYSPDLYTSDMRFSGIKKLSDINPQQKKYNWMNAELVEWTSFDNQKLQGILYKPENFDPAGKYPMIVYFYERSSDGLYSYFPPAPSASIINRSFAVSNGYLLFVPDIPYRIGYPGQSCYNAVVSGTYSLLNKYSYIDKDRLGLDGQSWGGYQIAWLVTQTDLFRCAYSGAAVVNMTSAYGGIRWESGMSRMFQYEHTQSRIGGTLWEKPINYIENSPIFFVPKINTPLLLMHNDADGAVPWYQGIEFITALRRMGKQAWLLSYNDEAHNLVRRANRKDISIRKMQFFDHYLKDSPAPYWMKYGIRQTQKGKIDGYDLLDE